LLNIDNLLCAERRVEGQVFFEAVAEVVWCAKVLVDTPNFLPLLMSA